MCRTSYKFIYLTTYTNCVYVGMECFVIFKSVDGAGSDFGPFGSANRIPLSQWGGSIVTKSIPTTATTFGVAFAQGAIVSFCSFPSSHSPFPAVNNASKTRASERKIKGAEDAEV